MRLMIPPRYSVTPLWSFVTTPIVRQPAFPDVVRIIWRWLRGDRPTLRQTFAEGRLIERLAEELEPEIILPTEQKATR